MSELDPNNTSVAKMVRQTRLDYEGINSNLLKNIEQLDSENVKIPYIYF